MMSHHILGRMVKKQPRSVPEKKLEQEKKWLELVHDGEKIVINDC